MSNPSDSDESDDDNNSEYVLSNPEGNKYSPSRLLLTHCLL